ncbi:hypothetical protein KIN20_002169, partial [Parelaphostrongylus tenuis]
MSSMERSNRPLIRMSRLTSREHDTTVLKATTIIMLCLVATTLLFILYQDAQYAATKAQPQ